MVMHYTFVGVLVFKKNKKMVRNKDFNKSVYSMYTTMSSLMLFNLSFGVMNVTYNIKH